MNPLQPPSVPPTPPNVNVEGNAALVQAATAITESQKDIGEIHADIRKKIRGELTESANELDSVHTDIKQSIGEVIQDCEQTVGIVCQKIKAKALGELYGIWNMAREAGSDIPSPEQFSFPSTFPNDPSLSPTAIPTSDTAVNQKSTMVEKPTIVGAPIQRPLPPIKQPVTGQVTQACPDGSKPKLTCPPGTTLDNGVCVSDYDGSVSMPAIDCGSGQTVKPPPIIPPPIPLPGPTPTPTPQPGPTPSPTVCPPCEPQTNGGDGETEPTCPVSPSFPCRIEPDDKEETQLVCEVTQDGVTQLVKSSVQGQEENADIVATLSLVTKQDDIAEIQRLGCNRYYELRNAFVQFGRCNTAKFQGDALANMLSVSYGILTSLLTEVSYINADNRAHILTAWGDFFKYNRHRVLGAGLYYGIEQIVNGRLQESAYLKIALATLEAFSSMSFSGALGGNHNDEDDSVKSVGGGIGAQLGKFITLGATGDIKRTFVDADSKSNELGYSIEIRPLVTPLIELCKTFCDSTNNPPIPSVDESIAMLLKGGCSYATYRCFLALNGADWTLYEGQVWANRNSLSPMEYQLAAFRKIISEEEKEKLQESTGMINPVDRKIVDELARPIPGPSDIVTFMLRDIEDPAIVKRFELEAEFEDKFKGQLKVWAEAQGLDYDYMIAYWKAHWRTIGIGQAYDMLHRQRPGHKGPNGEPLETTIDDVRALIAQDDVPKFWRDRLIDISYSPFTRVDIRRMRQIGLLSKLDVVEAYQDNGSDFKRATALADFTERLRFQSLRSLNTVKGFIAGLNSKEAMKEELQEYNATEGEFESVYLWALQKMQQKQKITCVKAIRTRFFQGEFDALTAQDLLNSIGVGPEFAKVATESWLCELRARGKTVSASVLCEWWTNGLITENEFLARLITIGYHAIDAGRLIARCKQKLSAKTQAAQEKQSKAAIAAAEKQRKQQEKQAKEAQALIDKAAKQRERQDAKADKIRAKLRKLARTIADIKEMSEEESASAVQHQINRLMNDRNYDIDDAQALVIDIGDELKAHPDLELDAIVDSLADAEDELLLSPEDADNEP